MTAVTEQPTQPVTTAEPTQPAVTETSEPSMEPSQTPSGTEALPSTGFVDPGRVSNLLDFEVYDKNNEDLGGVQDLIFNLDEMRVDYLVINMGGVASVGSEQVPVPWNQVELNTANAASGEGQSSSGSEQQNAFILKVSKDELAQAPTIDTSTIPQLGQPADEWDAEIQSFWSGNTSAGATETTSPQETVAPQATQAPSSTRTASAPGDVRTATGRRTGQSIDWLQHPGTE